MLSLLIAHGAQDRTTSVFAALAFAGALVLLPGVTGAVGRSHAAYLAEVEQRLADAERDRAERENAADDDVLYGALDAGASGFVLENSPPEALVAAVRAVIAGDAVLDPSVTARVMRRAAAGPESPPTANAHGLTDREVDVWWLLSQGCSNAEIGARLRVTEPTVKTHVSRVLAKLAVRDRVQAVIAAHRCGLAATTRTIAAHRAP